MKHVFADTSYYLALLGPADQLRDRAIRYSHEPNRYDVTTDYILNELANALHKRPDRGMYVALRTALMNGPNTIIVAASPELWEAGNALYAARPDKEWSLTDCISFVVMEEWKLTEALTADHHFTQAGFVALLG